MPRRVNSRSRDPLVPVKIRNVPDAPALEWASGERIHLPLELHRALCAEGRLESDGTLHAFSEAVGGGAETVSRMLLRNAFTDRRPAASLLPFSYRRIPEKIRTWTAKRMGRAYRKSPVDRLMYPAWPMDLSADFLSDLFSCSTGRKTAGSTPVLLSHDIDSAEGLENLAELLRLVLVDFTAQRDELILPGHTHAV